ncbi:hypothetical protein K469DRAFT_578063, partial [Zopfia rhizophila CBS 207.26]
ILENAPLQIYSSALIFAPEASIVRKAFVNEMPGILKGYTTSVTAVAFSPDGQLVASALDDSMVWVWEASTGSCRSVLKGHTNPVSAVAFSPDSQHIQTN